MPKARPVSERFWQKVKKTDGCWNWSGALDSHGYGQLYNGKTYELVHRLSWRLHRGPIPRRKFICHHCDNKICVNPLHLYVGDHKTNMRDRTIRKRHWADVRPDEFREHAKTIGRLAPRRFGENNPAAKLTDAEVAEIRASNLGLTVLAREYGVCYQHIWNLKTRRERNSE